MKGKKSTEIEEDCQSTTKRPNVLCTLTTGFHKLERFHNTGTGTAGSLTSKPQNLFENIRP